MVSDDDQKDDQKKDDGDNIVSDAGGTEPPQQSKKPRKKRKDAGKKRGARKIETEKVETVIHVKFLCYVLTASLAAQLRNKKYVANEKELEEMQRGFDEFYHDVAPDLDKYEPWIKLLSPWAGYLMRVLMDKTPSEPKEIKTPQIEKRTELTPEEQKQIDNAQNTL